MNLLEHVKETGYPLSDDSLIHLFVGGSGLHGAKQEGYDDLDIYGCYIEPPSNILGIQTMEHFVTSTSEEQHTSKDVDVTCYSLHRWAELMMKGNPAIIHYLYANRDEEAFGVGTGNGTVWDGIVKWAPNLLSKKAAKQYLGFANSQRMRLTGERGMGRHGQRQDLVDKYGYDTKFAMHYIRLLFECQRYLKHGKLKFPIPERAVLVAIRIGKWKLEDMFSLGKGLNSECEELLSKSQYPDNIRPEFISGLVSQAYLEHWEEHGQL